MALLNINGVDLPAPSTYEIGIMDITQAERNASGTMIMERIATKRKIQISYNYLSAADLSNILNVTSPVYYNLTYLDPVTDTYKTSSFYNGDRNMGLLTFINGVPKYKDLKINFIER